MCKQINLKILSLIVLVFASACNQKDSRNTKKIVAFGTFSSAIDYSPFYIAQHFGWIEEELSSIVDSVVFREYDNLQSITGAFDSGDLQFLFAAAPPVAVTKARGVDLSIFELSATLQQEILVKPNLGVSSVSDLRGLRIAVLQGTSSHYGLLKALEQAGISSDQIELNFMEPGIAQPAFERGDIDGWAIWPPFVEEQVIEEKGVPVRGGDQVIQSVAAVSENLESQNPDIVRAVASVLRRAKVWIMEHPEDAQVIVARKLSLDPSVVELAWGKHDWGSRLDNSFKEDIDNKIPFLERNDMLRRGTPSDFADNLINAAYGGSEPLSK